MKLIKYITTVFLLVTVASFVLVSCYKEDAVPEASNTLTATNVTPLEGSSGTLITVTGTGLAQIKSVVFANNNVPASFNPGLNSEGVIMFRVPDTAYGGTQDVILTNTLDKQVKVSFKVIALATVSGASAFEFEGGTQLTLMGNNLESVSSAILDGTTDAATIVSKTRKELVLTMPTSNVNRAKIKLTNASGVSTTTQEFANLAKAFVWFKDAMGPNVQDWSWCSVHAVNSTQKVQGSASMEAKFGNGAWQGLSFYVPTALNGGDYAYMSFWIKGGTQDNAMKIYSDQGGTPLESFPVPANVWTYMKVPMTGFLGGVGNLQRINFQMRGPNNADQTVFFDNVIFVK